MADSEKRIVTFSALFVSDDDGKWVAYRKVGLHHYDEQEDVLYDLWVPREEANNGGQ